MDLEGGGGTTVDVNETKGVVMMIVVITGEDKVMGGGTRIIEVEVVLITSLLLVTSNVTVVTKGIVTRVVDMTDTVEELGCGVEMLLGKVETNDELVKKTIVDIVIFVTLTKLLGNP